VKYKVKFISEPELKPKVDGHKFILLEDWTVILNRESLVIPQGFWTDLASTGILSPLNASMLPAILHDYLYYKQKVNGKTITREDADEFFFAGMKTTKFFFATVYFWGVRIGGWKPWNKYKNDRIKNKEMKDKNDKYYKCTLCNSYWRNLKIEDTKCLVCYNCGTLHSIDGSWIQRNFKQKDKGYSKTSEMGSGTSKWN
jgi:transcription elongation factor Elf1